MIPKASTPLTISLLVLPFLFGCAFFSKTPGRPDQKDIPAHLLFPTNLTRAVQAILPSVVEVAAVLEYRIEEFVYEKVEGRYIRDPESPVGYRLVNRDDFSGIIYSRSNTKAFGAGIVIGKSPSRYLILTSKHIVVQKDTIIDYIYINNRVTDIPRTRAILIHSELGVRGYLNILKPALIEVTDPRLDLALISVRRRDLNAREFPAKVLPELQPVTGHFAVAIGYPDEIQQVAMGLTSAAPYPGNFSVGIHGDFGFSGGPILIFKPEDGLVLAGIGKSIPGKRMFFVTPDSSLWFRTRLNIQDIPHLKTEELPLLSPHRIYGIKIEHVLRFLHSQIGLLERKGYKIGGDFFERIRKFKSSTSK